MKLKTILSIAVIVVFAILAGGSVQETVMWIVGMAVALVLAAIIELTINTIKKNRRLKFIEKEKEEDSDFDRSVSIGDDKCKLYFDAGKQKVMIVAVTATGYDKRCVDDFGCPDISFAVYYSGTCFFAYDNIRRKLLTGSCDGETISYEVVSLFDVDNNRNVTVGDVPPLLKTVIPWWAKQYVALVDESHGLVAVCSEGKLDYVLNYVDSETLERKDMNVSSVNIEIIGKYLFIMDDFCKTLVIVRAGVQEVISYADIVKASYEENGIDFSSASTGRMVGGAVVGQMLMGTAGAVVGGLSGSKKQSKEVESMNVKILLRQNKKWCILGFNDRGKFKTDSKDGLDAYQQYRNDAMRACDTILLLIDKVSNSDATKNGHLASQSVDIPVSTADELIKLAKLRDDGVITDEDFQTLKSKLLK